MAMSTATSDTLGAPSAELHSQTEGRTPPRYEQIPDPARVARVAEKLEANGIHAVVVSSKEEARRVVQELIPAGEEVFAATSRTLEEAGIVSLIEQPGLYRPTRPTLVKLREEGKQRELRQVGSSPAYVVGSVHAVTEGGQVVVASATGSQLAPYVFGASKVIWVVGAQKIVSDLDEAFHRVYDYTLPKESARARAAYGVPGSVVAKLLVINREVEAGRATLILVNEKLGF